MWKAPSWQVNPPVPKVIELLAEGELRWTGNLAWDPSHEALFQDAGDSGGGRWTIASDGATLLTFKTAYLGPGDKGRRVAGQLRDSTLTLVLFPVGEIKHVYRASK